MRTLPPWARVALLLVAAACVAIMLARQEPSAEKAVTRVHQADVRGTDAASGRALIRCTLCGGTGQAAHFGHDASGQPFIDGHVLCPACNGTGTEVALTEIRIVPDDEATIYAVGR